ncbi:MAG: CPBP family glutamic-type intramembrane protease [Oscillospiraceae bacterium]|nr:CPBP family glutamic-type intramembrane protease [Oscillospiraceae bacterium]
MADIINTQCADTDLFTYEDHPSENNPFCNETENSLYSLSYSQVIPAFFFRETPLSIRPTKFEKKRIKYFYNITGLVPLLSFLISTTVYIIINIILFGTATICDIENYSWAASLTDPVIRYSSMTISTIISTTCVFFLGCRYSGLKASDITGPAQQKIKAGTFDIICFFMSGLFISSLYTLLFIFSRKNMPILVQETLYFSGGLRQLSVCALWSCVITPVTGALIYRGVVLKNLSRVSQRFGIFASSILCALACEDILKFVPCLLMSVMLSYMTIKYNSIFWPLVIHIAVNICNTLISAYNDIYCNSDTAFLQLWTVITCLVGAVFLIFVLIREKIPSINKHQKKRTFSLFISSTAVIAAILIYAAVIALKIISA